MKIRHLLLFLFFGFRLFAQGQQYGMIYNSMYYTTSDNTFHFESYFAYGNGQITMTSTTQTVVGNTLYVRGYYNTCGFWPQIGGGDVHTVSYPIPANVTAVIMSTNIIHCQSGSPVTAEDVYTYSFNPTLNTIGFNPAQLLWFPNPVKDQLLLDTSAEPATAYELYTVQGQLVQSATGTTSTIECSALPKGIYLLRFEQNGVWKVEKICKD
ncbi:T9SS type A sorting domain-containing protein [Flavobacterium stagni]|uniref:T9SS type A sorting domain-containing protein n=1 Tax=Flavobacterium stagni TaxID=2506421 RepID=A0A4Q1KC77_9FLAO|nr:T9SS type A sorting domain-containing protein [Flavobacterium stagni]RXR24109.1 T9SS type A sorting domain-containing protein [Flavobacterium stagni]